MASEHNFTFDEVDFFSLAEPESQNIEYEEQPSNSQIYKKEILSPQSKKKS